MQWNLERLGEFAEAWEHMRPPEILGAARDLFGDRLTIASSFGLEDVCLIDMACRLGGPAVDVFCLDTDVLFPETLELMDGIESRYPIRLRRMRSLLSLDEQAAHHGDGLWARDPDLCCKIRKVEPLGRALEGYGAWVTGIRRAQSPTRAGARAIEWDARHGLVKVNPLVRWGDEEVWTYIRAEGVPYNPLHDRGYPSIGCVHCTRPVAPGEDPRAGRWAGFQKTECGLHQ